MLQAAGEPNNRGRGHAEGCALRQNIKINLKRAIGHAGLITLGVFVGFSLLAVAGPLRIGDSWPAWVQAVGSIAAIVFAVLVPRWTREAETEDRERKERAEALALATVMIRELEEFRFRIFMDLTQAKGADPHSIIEVNTKAIPQSLWSNALSLHKLGEPGENALRAIYSVHRARDVESGGTVVREDIRTYAEFMEKAYQHADLALDGLRATLE